MPYFSLQEGKHEIKMAEEYCSVITLAVSRSCCGQPRSSVLEFGFQLDTIVHTHTVEHTDTQFHSFISIQPLEAGLAGTRAQSCDRYGSGTLHPGQVLGGSLPLLSPRL